VPDALDRPRISAVVDAVVDRLAGDWLLIGGGLVALWLEPRRLTEDIDLIGIAGSGADRLATGRVFRPSAEAGGVDLSRVLAAVADLPPAADSQAASRRDRLRQALGVSASFVR
jgi:hypothetical protein